MKVLHVITTLGRGGIERWLLSMLRNIPRSECAMDICCRSNDQGAYAGAARQLGAHVYSRPLNIAQLPFIEGLRNLVRTERYDIVHNHLQVYAGLPVAACKTIGVPVISSFHCAGFLSDTIFRFPILRQARDLYGAISIRYALRRSAALTGCSQGVIDYMKTTYGCSRDDWRVIYYGTDVPPLASTQQRVEFRSQVGWTPDAKVIVHVGRFTKQKNHAGVLKVFQQLLRRVPNARLVLIGGGPLHAEVQRTIERHALRSSVALLGYRDDVPHVLSCSDLFLFPSWLEGLPVAILEASAAGLPVVASKIPALQEAIIDGVTGHLRDPEDTAGLADAAEVILTNPAVARALGSAGRNRIETQFSTDSSAAALMATYHECNSQYQRSAA
jgi:glycosyltransferase involved in cell wall biosynthesis